MRDRETNDEGTDLRTRRVVIYMTPDDAEELNRLSADLGMRSRSQLIVSILERHIISGFSMVGALKLCNQIQKRFEQRGGQSRGFYFGTRPLPALPDERADVKALKKALNNEIKHIEQKT